MYYAKVLMFAWLRTNDNVGLPIWEKVMFIISWCMLVNVQFINESFDWKNLSDSYKKDAKIKKPALLTSFGSEVWT